MKRSVRIAVITLAALVITTTAYLLLWPVPIDPVVWYAPAAPASDMTDKPSDAMAMAHRLELTQSHGPEDVAVGPDGQVYGGLADGSIVRWSQDGAVPTVFAKTGGRPLGLHFASNGNLIVADAFAGLLSVDPSGAVTALCTHASDGSKLVFTDDVDIARDGTIWFSDASTKFDQHNWKNDLLENRANGRLLRWTRESGECVVMLRDLYFANGVALAEDESFVLINETSRYRVRRLWLIGDKAGSNDIFADNLPGFNDGISRGDGVFWLAIPGPRNPMVDGAAPYPWLRKVMVRLPNFVQPDAPRSAHVIGLDNNGVIVHNIYDPAARAFGMVTSVQQHGDRLYLGSLREPAAAWMIAPTREARP
jgi:sugar lactone lactonase YvrE